MIPMGANIFVIDLQYCVPLEQVDPVIPAHIAFLDKYYASGVFLMSGAKVPRMGGVILAMTDCKDTIYGLIKEDPFHIKGIAKYTVTEFIPSKKSGILS